MPDDNTLSSSAEFERYLDTLDFFNDTWDNRLFLWELKSDQVYYTGDFFQSYDLPTQPKGHCSLEEWLHIVYSKDRPAVRYALSQIANGESKILNINYRLVNQEGNTVWVNVRGKVQLTPEGDSCIMLGRIVDTLRQKADPLTGLFNMEKFQEDMEDCVENHTPGYLLLFGIDNFKKINNSYGRNYGNRILQKTAEALDNALDISQKVYRLNGDHFAVHLPDGKAKDAKRLYEQVSTALFSFCTLSAGAVSLTDDLVKNSGMLYQYAENALSRAKRTGRNRLVFFSPDNFEQHLNKLNLYDQLTRSVQNNFYGFFLCYQPIIDAQTMQVNGAEALLRYYSPTRGIVMPDEFIPLLEQGNLIIPIGLWVLETALTQCRQWRKILPDFNISVNISYIQLRLRDITGSILEILKQSSLPGSALTLEIAESTQIQDYSHFNNVFCQWAQAGIQIAIDDFGTGYSNLSHLKSMEINIVKIDKCFIQGIQHSAYNHRLLTNMIDLAHAAQIQVCCEGVETADELRVLQELQPDTLQGYLFSQPCSKEDFENNFLYPETIERFSYLRKHFQPQTKTYDQLRIDKPVELENLGSIMDFMDDIIYISDKDTYELYYLSPAGRVISGISDYKGRKCYQVLYDQNQPCSACCSRCPKSDDFTVWDNNNPHLNRHFRHKSKLIPWMGQQVRMTIAQDITGYELINQDIRKRLDFEQNIVSCSRTLAEEPDIEKAILQVLDSIGDFYRADRVYIFEPHEMGTLWDNTYEWCREGVISLWAVLQNLPASTFQQWFAPFQEHKDVVIFNVNDIKSRDPKQWKELSEQGVRRLLATPIWKDQKLLGFIGIDNPMRNYTDTQAIRTMAYFLADRIRHDKTERLLNDLLSEEYVRKSDFYRSVLADTVAYAEIDVDDDRLLACGGLWKTYKEESKQYNESCSQLLTRNALKFVPPEYMDVLLHSLSDETMKEMYHSNELTRKLNFQRLVDDSLRWMTLTIHVFREHLQAGTYALLYLNDIDAEKKREQLREAEADLDALTNIYNRRAFQKRVTHYMTEEEGGRCGALVMLDLDNFKTLNDTCGHAAGDEALKHIAETLTSTFRSNDLVGRLGGDEFVVFLKDVNQVGVVSSRMDQFFAALHQISEFSQYLSCSAGIAFTNQEIFSFDELLKQADNALYKIKQNGKNNYGYFNQP